MAMLCLFGIILVGHVKASDKVDKQPNTVLVFMDNFGWGELGCFGGGVLRGAPTPRIDSLAQDGMRLLNFNVEAQCTPSRAANLTGRYGCRRWGPCKDKLLAELGSHCLHHQQGNHSIQPLQLSAQSVNL